MGISPLAILVLEHDPPQWGDWPQMLQSYAQIGGGFAFVGLLIYCAVRLTLHLTAKKAQPWSKVLLASLACLGLSAVLLGIGLGIQGAQWFNKPAVDPTLQREEFVRTDKLPTQAAKATSGAAYWADQALTAGGAIALIGFCLPFLLDIPRWRLGRIGSLARLSFKEAIRRGVVWAPMFLLLIFMFPPKWFFQGDPKDEVSTYVSVIYWAITPIMLLVASLLAAFAIPNDMKNQTIHTVVTKPVERFEIVLGRSLGYIMLITVMLLAFSGVSLLLLHFSDPSEEARFESYKAREPVYGNLEFRKLYPQGGSETIKGESVGREWEYRSYIAGATPQRAIWTFNNEGSLKELAARSDAVPCEFSFDIFRTTKGDENKGVTCTFEFVTHKWGDPYVRNAQREQAYQDAVRGLKKFSKPGDADWEKQEQIAEKFGYFRFPSKEISDYHTFNIEVPRGLIRAALENRSPNSGDQPRLMVIVKCESPAQFIGVAKGDLYLLAGDQHFALNFLKGVFGLWLRVVLVIVVAVACSTYLSGVIAWLIVWSVYIAGMFQEYIAKLAAGVSVGGGPAESLLRLSEGKNITIPLTESAGKSIVNWFDWGFEFVLRGVLNAIPDIDRFSWSNYVSSGFNISWAEIVFSSLALFGYLLIWAVAANYLFKSREIAA